jgi:Ankyrin repeats (3 copies)
MKNSNASNSQRRKFIRQTMGIVLSVSALPSFGRQAFLTNVTNPPVNDKKPALPPELVFEFVKEAHFNLPRVKEMLGKEPMLVNACWDWGGGDFETALGGASHLGNPDIANYLLEQGARKDIFCSAMLGDRGLVKSFIKSNPGIADVDGPHHFTLLYHVAISGDTKMAALIKEHVSNAADFNQALHAAARGGHYSMAEWLLKHGSDNPNTTDYAGNTPLQTAEKKGFNEMVEVLKKYGGK